MLDIEFTFYHNSAGVLQLHRAMGRFKTSTGRTICVLATETALGVGTVEIMQLAKTITILPGSFCPPDGRVLRRSTVIAGSMVVFGIFGAIPGSK